VFKFVDIEKTTAWSVFVLFSYISNSSLYINFIYCIMLFSYSFRIRLFQWSSMSQTFLSFPLTFLIVQLNFAGSIFLYSQSLSIRSSAYSADPIFLDPFPFPIVGFVFPSDLPLHIRSPALLSSVRSASSFLCTSDRPPFFFGTIPFIIIQVFTDIMWQLRPLTSSGGFCCCSIFSVPFCLWSPVLCLPCFLRIEFGDLVRLLCLLFFVLFSF